MLLGFVISGLIVVFLAAIFFRAIHDIFRVLFPYPRSISNLFLTQFFFLVSSIVMGINYFNHWWNKKVLFSDDDIEPTKKINHLILFFSVVLYSVYALTNMLFKVPMKIFLWISLYVISLMNFVIFYIADILHPLLIFKVLDDGSTYFNPKLVDYKKVFSIRINIDFFQIFLGSNFLITTHCINKGWLSLPLMIINWFLIIGYVLTFLFPISDLLFDHNIFRDRYPTLGEQLLSVFFSWLVYFLFDLVTSFILKSPPI